MKSKEKNNIFEKHRKKTILIFIISVIFITDFTVVRTYELIFGYPWYERVAQRKKAAEKSYRIASELYHHDLAKNMSVDYANWGPITFRVFTNSLGFKDQSVREIFINPEKYRIIFIGDSFTEGNGVEYSDTFTGLISSELANKGIEVLNAGVASYSPIIYWRKIKYLIEDVRLKFDELIVFIDFSDADNDQTYILGDDGNIRPPDNKESDKNNKYRSEIEEEKITLHNLIKNNSIFLFYVANKVKKLSFIRNKGGNLSSPEFHTFRLQKGLDHFYKQIYPNGLLLMKKHMNMLYNLLEKHNIKMTIAIYPWPDQVLDNDLNNIHTSSWSDWAKEKNVKFLNYFPYFIKSGNSELENQITITKYFIPGDVHWNAEGHRLIANTFLSVYEKPDVIY